MRLGLSLDSSWRACEPGPLGTLCGRQFTRVGACSMTIQGTFLLSPRTRS